MKTLALIALLTLTGTVAQAETLMALNCVDGRKTANPDDYAIKQAREWKESAQFAGILVPSEAEAKFQTQSFFSTGQFGDGSQARVLYNTTYVRAYNPDSGEFCVLKSGTTEP